jgi:hypothetical protein
MHTMMRCARMRQHRARSPAKLQPAIAAAARSHSGRTGTRLEAREVPTTRMDDAAMPLSTDTNVPLQRMVASLAATRRRAALGIGASPSCSATCKRRGGERGSEGTHTQMGPRALDSPRTNGLSAHRPALDTNPPTRQGHSSAPPAVDLHECDRPRGGVVQATAMQGQSTQASGAGATRGR